MVFFDFYLDLACIHICATSSQSTIFLDTARVYSAEVFRVVGKVGYMQVLVNIYRLSVSTASGPNERGIVVQESAVMASETSNSCID